MKVERLIVGQLQTNCYLVWDKVSGEGVIIDPGDDADLILNRLRDLEIKPLFILATHGHFDHVLAVLELKLVLGIPFLVHQKDLFLLKRAVTSASHFTDNKEALLPLADKYLQEKKIIVFGSSQLEVQELPGHTPGGVIFLGKSIAFSGDSLFYHGVGRTDLSYSSNKDLLDGIRNKLFILPEETIVYPGHGEETTIEEEKENFNLVARV